MIVLFTIVISILLVAIFPGNQKYRAMIMSAVLLGSLYLFFSPPMEYDLFKEYEFLNYIKNLSFSQLFDSAYRAGNKILNDLSGASNVYVVLAWLISKLSFPRLLPFFVSLVVYCLVAKRIEGIAMEMDSNSAALVIAFASVLLTLDFRSISAIRNILAYSILAYTVYEDLVNNKNKVLCFIIYFLLCQIHMTVAVFVLIRVAIIVFNRANSWILIIGSLLAFRLLSLVQKLLSLLPQTAFISLFLYKTERYVLRFGEGLAEYGHRRALSYLIMILVYLLIFYMVQKSKSLPAKFDKFNIFYLSSLAITIGAKGQYDFFVRNCMLISFLSVPYVMYACNHCVNFGNGTVSAYRVRNISGETNTVFTAITIAVFLYMAVFSMMAFYTPMNQYFSLFG